MKPKTQRKMSRKVPPATRLIRCPYCTESLGADKIHICPAGCCYVGSRAQTTVAVCPHCSESFTLKQGHVCTVLLRLTEPAQ